MRRPPDVFVRPVTMTDGRVCGGSAHHPQPCASDGRVIGADESGPLNLPPCTAVPTGPRARHAGSVQSPVT
jgi:hypothetical protein